jgi:uncharacterized lipoprotein YddW (UPF0748 family)
MRNAEISLAMSLCATIRKAAFARVHFFRGPGTRQAKISGVLFTAVAFLTFAAATVVKAQSPEYRGFWVYAWGSDLLSSSGVSTVVNDTRAANMNMVIPQVRRRGDAFYNSAYEPRSHSLSGTFDPLADLIAKAHNTDGGQRLEVHPWIVTYHVWKTSSTYPLPPQLDHVVNRHPDWLLENDQGQTLIGGEYTLDPGHPGVQQHTYNVCMDIVANYDVDGLNFDYIRYSSYNEGYNPVSVARFNRITGRTGTPPPTDLDWKQFRRDQVTALLRKVYLNALALKPWIKISCDTITWTPAPTSDATWFSGTAAWNNVLQDWRGWMEEGILDLNIPMAYFRATVPAHALAYTNWSNFAKDHKFNRHLIVGPGIYLNGIEGSILQMRHARAATPLGRRADGSVGYVFHATNTNGEPRSTFIDALTKTSSYDPITPPLFQTKVSVPQMTWKAAPTKGHLKGFVYGGGTNLDSASINVTGPSNRGQTNDATGFYGFVDLAPGTYTVTASYPGFETVSQTSTITAGAVRSLDFTLPAYRAPAIIAHPVGQMVEAGSGASLSVTASGSSPLKYQWRHEGTNLPGATASTYDLQQTPFQAAGKYHVVVTNLAGSAISSNAIVTVVAPTPADFTTVERLSDGRVLLQGTGTPGAYYIDWSPDLTQWLPLTNITSPTNGFYYIDVEANGQQRFYRARRLP